MNYLRGAVNAISAPYQYYKELPPLNPSTLTGAIDVIVVQRPTDNGDTELACSPFHVRFGKWQVLRPSEKKVNVSVNGQPIPFNMKIGDAGEAFFVFETDDDVPDDLITSPILQPTRPDQAKEETDIEADQTGAKQVPQPNEDARHQEATVDRHEPDFLDLNASSSTKRAEDKYLPDEPSTPRKTDVSPPESVAAQSLPSPPPSPPLPVAAATTSKLPSLQISSPDGPDRRVDDITKALQKDLCFNGVQYHDEIALDAHGYHTHERDISEQTIRLDNNNDTSGTLFLTINDSALDSDDSESMQKAGLSLYQSQSSHSDHNSVAFPVQRATSEPPPDMNDINEQQAEHPPLAAAPPMQEYSWEWGAFPQPSPLKTTFSRTEAGLPSQRDVNGTWSAKGKSPVSNLVAQHLEDIGELDYHRSRSVPPQLEGSPSRKRRKIPDYTSEDEAGGNAQHEEVKDAWPANIMMYGSGGRLAPDESDSTFFIILIEGKKVVFELSLVSFKALSASDEGERGRQGRDGGRGGIGTFDGLDEIETAVLFDKGKVDYARFMRDESIVNSSSLVIRWAGDRYITRNDGSPFMQALVQWRDYTLHESLRAKSSPSISIVSDDEESPTSNSDIGAPPAVSEERKYHDRAKSEPPETPPPSRKSTSSSWVRWWSRSKTTKDASKAERPSPRESSSAPSNTETAVKTTKVKQVAESAPALPSTPVQEIPIVPLLKTTPQASSTLQTAEPRKRKFAKTLRLTSDQLKALNLKVGANTITFALSATGIIACTARIFVWDSTDLIVVSDIDGTITKSDGLGHVFAMIGRDWTHLGVAKLYTDISRNGYKIMYLTSRAIGQADATRDYLKGIKQNDYQLPEGPVIMSPDRLMASLHREVIMRKPEVFKMACLRDIQRLFGEHFRNPFYAGFGNRITDALSYRSVNVPSSRIFTIDSSGEVKLELLELAGYKSSYIHMTDLVDQMFPPIHRKWAPEYTDFNYWKTPVQEFPLPDLSPPSPTLSARSDTSSRSALARLRNFSLVGSRSSNARPATADNEQGDLRRSSQLVQMSSFERLSNTLSSFTQSSSSTVGNNRRSASPGSHSSSSYTYADSDDSDDEGVFDTDGKRRKRDRRRSMTSMPGSLDDINFEMDDDEDNAGADEYGGHGDYNYEQEYKGEYDGGLDDEQAAEQALDEDILAAGEMKDVPFL